MSGRNGMMDAIEDEDRLNSTILGYQQRDAQHPYNKKLTKSETFVDGIERERTCTDKLCCIFFVVTVLATITLTIYTYSEGELKYLVHGTDFRASPCGEGSMEERKYVYWPIPSQDTDVRMCLADCPDTYSAYACYYTPDGKHNFDNGQIDPDIAPRDNPYCHPTMETEKLAFYCIPQEPYSNQQVRKAIEKDSEALRLIGRDVFIARWIMLAAVVLAIVISLIACFLFLCNKITVIIGIVLSCLGTLVALIVLAVTFYKEYQRNVDLFCLDGVDRQGCAGKYADFYLDMCYGSIFVTLLYLISLAVMARKFKKLVPAFVVSAKTLNRISNLWLYPIGSLLVMLFTTYSLLYACLYALTIGERKLKSANGIPEGKVAYYDYDNVKGMTFFLAVVYIWYMLILQAAHYYVLSSSSLLWYFDHEKRARKTPTMKISVWYLLRYNAGSIVHAVTALPLTFPFKMIIGSAKRRMEKAYYKSKVSAFLINVMATCFQVYELYLKYISMNGIVQVASSGKSYRKSSQLAYYILRRNYSKIKSLTFFMYYVITLTRLTASLFAFILTYYVARAEQDTNKDHSGVVNPVFPALTVFFISVLATAPFVDIFDAVFDSIAQALIMDEELNDYDRVAQETIDHFDDIIALDFDDDEIQTFEPQGKGMMFDHITPNAAKTDNRKNQFALKMSKKKPDFDTAGRTDTERPLGEVEEGED
eukprot:CAMPEP_0114994920 /NCGR_PEP_ID=MMETSP0216-20121206/13420_1 /TAXON_ID=223996 /ORGANISM="Protocruzia adherens, Strain Boccale" /LENGTH=705 /DNA_ID=CAMNT_0002358861 /DNA_START=108 /DNA_END=2225 /DNA_ORIENTATION=+